MAQQLRSQEERRLDQGRRRTAGVRAARMVPRSAFRILAGAILVVGLGGCGLSSITSGLSGGVFGGSSENAAVKSVTEEQLLSAAKADFGGGNTVGTNVAHGCPRFVVWSPGNHATTFLPGREGDAMAVMHRGEITKTARECKIEPGRVTVKYGFSGRVIAR